MWEFNEKFEQAVNSFLRNRWWSCTSCSMEQCYRLHKLANNIKRLFNINNKWVFNGCLIILDIHIRNSIFFYISLFIVQMHGLCSIYIIRINCRKYCMCFIWFELGYEAFQQVTEFCLIYFFSPEKNIQNSQGRIYIYICSFFSSEVTKALSIFTCHFTQPLSSSHQRFTGTLE